MRLRIAVLALLCAAPVFAFEPYLVKDINPLYRSDGSSPTRFASLGSTAVFEATTAGEGRELWASDGTAAGTFLLADVCPGACSGNLRGLLATPKGYFFSAANQSGERELWVTGGTPASTIRLATRLVASWEVLPLYLESQGVLYFAGSDDAQGMDLWRSDGTPAGTYRVADLPPAGGGFGRFVLFSGRIFFSTNEGNGAGPSLWVSDGTAAGTRLLKRAWPENGLMPLDGMVPTSRFLYFFAPSPKGLDLWRSDGTSKGTRLVADLNLIQRPGELALHGVAILGGRLLFVGEADAQGDEVWASDGTAAGTRKITNFTAPMPFGRYGLIHPLFPLGNRLVFAVNDGTKGNELWATDGTAKGTRLLVDLFPGPGSGVSFLSQIYKGRLLFSGTDGRRGQELWSTDGTPQGTRMVRDICRGSCSSSAVPLTLLGDQLLLVADDGRSGRKIWKTNGTAAGTVPVTDLIPDGGVFQQIALPGKLLFTRRDATYGAELWVTDGTAAGTGLVADLNDANQSGSFPGDFLRLGNTLLFAAYDGQRSGLWKSDGTAEGTTFVHDLNPDPSEPPSLALEIRDSVEAGGALFLKVDRGGNSPFTLWRTDGTAAGTVLLDLGQPVEQIVESLRALGDKIFFVSRDNLWVSDGTAAGTRKLTGLVPEEPGAPGSHPQWLTVYQGKLFFSGNGPYPANAPYLGRELWKTDGTVAGTVLVRDVDWGNLSPTLLTVHQGLLYFSGEDDEHGRELWVSDGTAAGTRRVTDVGPEFESFHIGAMTSAGPLLLLWDAGTSGQSGLWVSDGTEAGTRRISPVTRPHLSIPPVLLDGVVYFLGQDGASGTLWRSDGTSAGTYPVLDTVSSTNLGGLTTVGGLLFFKQSDALWRSDGTAAGTAKVRDRVDFPLLPVGPRLFFPAYDPATGTELWAIDTRED